MIETQNYLVTFQSRENQGLTKNVHVLYHLTILQVHLFILFRLSCNVPIIVKNKYNGLSHHLFVCCSCIFLFERQIPRQSLGL